MQNPPPGQIEKSSTGLDANLAALLSYVFGLVSGLVFYLLEKESRLVRFHAMQSILLNVILAVVGVVLGFGVSILILILRQASDVLAAVIGLVSGLFWLAFSVIILVIWISCLIRAYQGKMFKLPIIGNMAEKIVNK